MVIDVPCVIKVFGRKGALKAGISHAECHCVHMNKRRIRLSFAQFFFASVDVTVNRYRNIDSLTPSHSDMLGQGPKAWMVGDMIVIDVQTLSDFVVDWLLRISNS